MNYDYDCALASLYKKLPNIDVSSFTTKDTGPPKSQNTLVSAIFRKIVQDMEVHLDMTAWQKAVFQCLCAPHAQNFLLAIPIDELDQHMSHVEYRTILKYRLTIPIFPIDEICPVCCKPCLDSFGEHTVHYKELPGFKYKHNIIRDVLFNIFNRVR